MPDSPILLVFCGKTGIRTPDTLWRYTRFPGVPLKPLEHLSLYSLTSANKLFLICGCKGNNFSLKIHISVGYLILFNNEITEQKCLLSLSACIPHLIEQLLLLIREISWKLDIVGDDQIAVGAVTAVVTFSTQAHLRAVLCLRFNLQLDL